MSDMAASVRERRPDPLTELRRGVLEYCVLAIVRDDETYAFDLIRRLAEAGGLMTSEGTIYPLLGRLRRDGLVTTTWRESVAGPPRRYYRITPAGNTALTAFIADWAGFRDAVDALVGTRERSKGS
jgi:PadR family transcriptional regulator, regulatory protein PadR